MEFKNKDYVTIPLLILLPIILFFISDGHGRELYIIAKVFFPYNWILYILDPLCSDVLTFYIFFLHWPLYGFFIGLARSKKSQCRRCFLVSLVHVLYQINF